MRCPSSSQGPGIPAGEELPVPLGTVGGPGLALRAPPGQDDLPSLTRNLVDRGAPQEAGPAPPGPGLHAGGCVQALPLDGDGSV